MNFPINHIQHIGIPVTDINISQTFYEKFGFTNVMESSFEYNGCKGNVVMMQRGNMIIELYRIPEPEPEEIISRNNGHIDHIAFDVDDIEEAFDQLKKEQFNVLEEAPVFLSFWKNGCRYFNITGPDGERLEFNQVL